LVTRHHSVTRGATVLQNTLGWLYGSRALHSTSAPTNSSLLGGYHESKR